jgi:gentisate 1,2-dioxygenase
MSTSETLGTAAELPTDYRRRLEELSVLPAWTLLRSIMPVGKAVNQAKPFQWRYRDLRAELIRAGDLVPVEKAERRVLALVNPGFSADRLATLPSIFFGLQLIKPGERAPSHLHIPAAARVIMEGEGAYTSVEGEEVLMDEGDLILTPPHFWHDHGHDGRDPMIWMDVLDHTLAVPLEFLTSCRESSPSIIPIRPTLAIHSTAVPVWSHTASQMSDVPIIRCGDSGGRESARH